MARFIATKAAIGWQRPLYMRVWILQPFRFNVWLET
jgi:hypothetical protein